MTNDPIGDLIQKIDAYDGSGTGFMLLLTDALFLVPTHPKLRDLGDEMAKRCVVARSTIGRWARSSLSTPEKGVRQNALDRLKEILDERRP